jgi:tetratricopeptide (TPR) repeat protein
MTVTHALNVLETGGLIRLAAAHPELAYAFRHALVQEAAYLTLVKSHRREVHKVVGESLEQIYSAELASPGLAPVLARHFDEGGDPARALNYYILAGRAALDRYAIGEAVHHFSRALVIAKTQANTGEVVADLFLSRGRALELNAQDAEALENYQELERWAAEHDDRRAWLAAMTARATIYVRPSVQGDLARGYELSQQALALARELGDRPAEAKVLWNLLQHEIALGKIQDALAYGEQALAIARADGLREQVAYVLTDLWKVYAMNGQSGRAQAAVVEAQGLWRELGALNMLADSLASTAFVQAVAGNYQQAVALSEEAEQVSRSIGNVWNQSYALYIVNLVHFDRGDIGRAIAITDECARLAEQAGFAEGLVQSGFARSLMYAYLGALPQAFAAARELQARVQVGVAYADSARLAEAMLPFLLILDGRLAEAQSALDRFPIAQNQQALQEQFILLHLVVSRSLVELALAKGEAEQALELAESLIAHFQREGTRLFFPDALWLRGRALAAAGRPGDAQSAFEVAHAAAAALGSRRTLWLILAELAGLAEMRGEQPAARELRRQTAEHIAYIAEHAGAAELRESFLNRADVRAALAQAA